MLIFQVDIRLANGKTAANQIFTVKYNNELFTVDQGKPIQTNSKGHTTLVMTTDKKSNDMKFEASKVYFILCQHYQTRIFICSIWFLCRLTRRHIGHWKLLSSSAAASAASSGFPCPGRNFVTKGPK